MKIKLITSYKPGTWDTFAKRGIDSMVANLPHEIDIFLYCEEAKPKDVDKKIQCIDLNTSEPALINFKNKYKNDPVANGKLTNLPNGVRRSNNLKGLDKDKESFLWDAVRFSNKVFCIINAIRNSNDYDYVLWLDADTYTFKPVPISLFKDLLKADTMLTYLGRGDIYPECGFVGYNLKHKEIQNFVNDWEKLYVDGSIFNLLEWHDSAVFWHLSKIYTEQKGIAVNDIGHAKGVKGHHVFVNSVLGSYIDHFKGNRKSKQTSSKKDLTKVSDIDYWKNAPPV